MISAAPKPLVYMDQNIVGQHVAGQIDLVQIRKDRQDVFDWAYSHAHFAEISRAEDPYPYLGALDTIDAKLIDLELDRTSIPWRLTGDVWWLPGSAREHYRRYPECSGAIELNAKLLSPFFAWRNGGGDQASLEQLPNDAADTLRQSCDRVLQRADELDTPLATPHDRVEAAQLREWVAQQQQEVQQIIIAIRDYLIPQMINNDHDIHKIREAYGNHKGTFGNFESDNAIPEIWESKANY